MKWLWLPLVVGACGPKAPLAPPMPPPGDAWVVVHPSTPALCLPWLGDPDLASVADWNRVVALLQGRDLEGARAAMPDVPEHPAMQGLAALLQLVSGEVEPAVVALDGLVRDHGSSPCLLAASATGQEMIGDAKEAAKRISLARSMAPDEPELALMFAYMASVDDAHLALPALEAGALADPDRLGFAIALGVAAITQGDAESAANWLEKAVDGGDTKVSPLLLTAYRAAERSDDYLRLAASMGLPVPEALATSEMPMAELRAQWGVIEGVSPVVNITTSMGSLTCELFLEVAPVTVNSFLGLADGSQTWFRPEGGPGEGPLYHDLVFHRVIPDFMVQTGDPLGTGEGGPGYRFPDEVQADVGFDRAGRLAMANSGPGTNGSQFFITEAPTPHLDGSHTIFGQCDDNSVQLVGRIARYPKEVMLRSITLVPRETP